jgi:tight adherence protein C
MITLIVFFVTCYIYKKSDNSFIKKTSIGKLIFTLEIIGILTFGMDYLQNRVLYTGEITRNEAGAGSEQADLEYKVSGKNRSMKLDVDERKLTAQEKKEYIKRAETEIDKTFPGENKNINSIKDKVIVKNEYQNGKVSAAWNFNREDIVTPKGEVKNETIHKNQLVDCSVVLSCDDVEETYNFSIKVIKPDIKNEKDLSKLVESTANDQEEKNKQKKTFVLPESIQGIKVNWKKPVEKRGEIICVLGLIVLIIWPLREKEIIKLEKKKKEEELERDYPEIMRKLSLFVGCGMTVKKSFEIIVKDYSDNTQKRKVKKRSGYETVQRTIRSIQSGMGEIEAYEAMGREERIFRKLSTILTQNLRLGTKDMQQKLDREAIDAETRERQRIRMSGEKISTRLLVPLLGMLGIVMVVLMVPAMWGISI